MGEEHKNLLWVRPTTVPWPKVWHRYEVESKDGQIHRIKIQDIPENRFDEILDFMEKEFDKNAPISSCTTVAYIFEDKNVRSALRSTRNRILEQKISLFAVLDTDDPTPKIMGVALLLVTSQNEPPLKVPSPLYTNVALVMDYEVRKNVDTTKLFDTTEYIEDFGIAVAAEYYGLGISYHIFEALANLAVTFGIGGAQMIFSSRFSQASAEKAGFKVLNELKFEDFKDENGKIKLPIENTKFVKFMYTKYI